MICYSDLCAYFVSVLSFFVRVDSVVYIRDLAFCFLFFSSISLSASLFLCLSVSVAVSFFISLSLSLSFSLFLSSSLSLPSLLFLSFSLFLSLCYLWLPIFAGTLWLKRVAKMILALDGDIRIEGWGAGVSLRRRVEEAKDITGQEGAECLKNDWRTWEGSNRDSVMWWWCRKKRLLWLYWES